MEIIVREGGAEAILARDDQKLLKQCRVDTYIASGPGGQHRNRTYSAVRLTHLETGVKATGEERRSQHENKQRALARLRMALALQVRSGCFCPGEKIRCFFSGPGTVRMNSKNELYPVFCATLLDALHSARGSLSGAAELLGISTGRLARLISHDGDLLTAANRLRDYLGLKSVQTG
jgi:hypothetical protein